MTSLHPLFLVGHGGKCGRKVMLGCSMWRQQCVCSQHDERNHFYHGDPVTRNSSLMTGPTQRAPLHYLLITLSCKKLCMGASGNLEVVHLNISIKATPLLLSWRNSTMWLDECGFSEKYAERAQYANSSMLNVLDHVTWRHLSHESCHNWSVLHPMNEWSF